MLLRASRLLAAGLLLQGQAPPPKSWIADLKANREALATKEVRLEGDVVDIRSTSPAARAGFYRIIDATDAEGVLLRTDKLPRDGGALRVRARIAAQQVEGSPLLLDELDQQRIDRRPIAPILLGVTSLGMLLILTVLLIRAAITERKVTLSPPLWLLPEAGPYGKALATPNAQVPALTYNPELEEADRIQRTQLKRRKRSLLQAMLVALAAAASSVAWFVTTKPASAQVPQFIFIAANDLPVPAPNAPEVDQDSAKAVVDSLMLALHDANLAQERSREAAQAARDSIRKARAQTPNQPGSENPPISPVPLPEAVPPGPSPAPASSPPPPPPPPPAPVREEPRDPEADRVAASQLVTTAAGRLVDAINSRQFENVARLLPESMSGDLKRRERFIKLLRDYSPRASLMRIEGTTLAANRAEAKFSMELEWRGDFGVGDRKTAQFVGVASHTGSDWRYDGARLLNSVP